MSMKGLMIIALIVVIFVYIISIYNRLIAMIEAVRNNQKQIDIQLDRRYKVFQSLLEVVKKYMDYEKTTLKDVVALRNQAQSAKAQGDAATMMQAENKISGVLSSGLNVVFEQYPDLKANQNAMQLQEEIVSTENKLAFSKQALNDSIERYNAFKKSFFQALIVKLFGNLNQDFPYWQLDAETVKQQENFTVKF